MFTGWESEHPADLPTPDHLIIICIIVSKIDRFSVSLNGENEEIYNKISQPNIDGAYTAVKDFIKEAVKEGFDTTATIVTNYKGYDVDMPKCIEITEELGAKFRERPWIENGY